MRAYCAVCDKMVDVWIEFDRWGRPTYKAACGHRYIYYVEGIGALRRYIPLTKEAQGLIKVLRGIRSWI